MADISDLPTPSKSDISDLPSPPSAPKEKGMADYAKDYGKAVQRSYPYGMARGAITTTAGLPGEVERLGRHLIPKISNKPILLTTEDVSRGLSKIGLPEPQGMYGKTGEFVGGFVPIGTGAAKVGKAAFEATPLTRLLPSATEKAKAALKPLGEAATDESRLGAQMKTNLENRLNTLRTSRSAEAEKAKKLYFAKAAGKEEQVLENYNNFIQDELTNNIRNLSPAEKKLLIDSDKRLQGNPSIEAIEKELRYLKDMADTPRMVQGYESIPIIKAGELAKKLENFLPQEGKVFRQKYKEMSEPVNIFDTLKGRKAVGEETDPATLPNAFFKTKDSVRRLRQLTQNEDEVRRYANQHALNELSSLDPKQAVDWYNKNKTWLEEIKPTNEAVKQYVDQLNDILKTRETAGKVAKGAGLVGVLGGIDVAFNKLRSILGT